MNTPRKRGPIRAIGAVLALVTSVSLMAQDGPKLAAYWDFNDASNPDRTLDKIYGFEGLIEGDAFFSTGRTGGAGDNAVDFGFTSANQLVRIDEVPFLNAAGSQDQITISFWQINGPALHNSSAFWGVSPSSSGGERGIQAHTPWSDGNIYFDTAGCCDGATQRISGNVTTQYPGFTAGNDWFHVLFLKDGATKQVWINGSLLFEGNNTSPLPTDFTSLVLGAEPSGANSMQGAMDDFAVFIGALSPASIGELASGTAPDALPGVPVMADPLIALNGSATGFTMTVRDSPSVQLAPASVTVQFNGATVAADVAKVGSVTTVTYSLAPNWLASGSVNTVVLNAQDTGGSPIAASLEFTVASFATLPTGVRSPIGSETAAQPGFNVRTWQLANRGNTMANNNEWAEGVLAGLVDENVGDRTGFVNDVYAEATTINYAQLEGQMNGNFTPDRQHPGIVPGVDSPNYASDFVTYLVFPQAGLYTMGVNSDDNFRVTIGGAVGRQYLEVLAPASVAGGMAAVASATGLNAAFGGPLPTVPIAGDVVYLGEGCRVNPEDPNPVTEDLTGKVGLFIRGTCTFVEKSRNAQERGAIAVIIANNEANAELFPITMGGDGVDVTIPVMMVDYDDGQRLINATGLRVSIGKDTNLELGEFNGGGRGASDTIFPFAVPQAGVYPFRCFYLQGGGGANVEWFTVAEDGTRILVNDTVEGAVMAYRARTFTPPTEVTGIGLNFGADEAGGALAATDVAGAPGVAQANWNNLNALEGSSSDLVGDSHGSAQTITATVAWTSANLWASTGRGEENNAFAGANLALMTGYLDTGADTTSTVTLSGIPEDLTEAQFGYDVYVYALGGVPGRGGSYQVVDPSDSAVLRGYIKAQSPTNPAEHMLVPTSDPNAWGAGTYLVFKNLTATSIRVEATTVDPWGFGSPNRAPINAVQLVPATSAPQPRFTSIVKNADGSLTVAWEGGGVLQAAPTVSGPWETVDGAASPFTLASTEAMLYGRIRAD